MEFRQVFPPSLNLCFKLKLFHWAAIGGRSIRDQPSHPIQQKQVRDLPQQLNLKRRQTGQGSAAELALLSPAEFRKRLRSKEQALPEEEEESSSLAGGTQRLKQEWVQELVGSVQEEVEQLKKLAASGHAETGDEQNLVELRRKALAQAAAVDADESNDDRLVLSVWVHVLAFIGFLFFACLVMLHRVLMRILMRILMKSRILRN